MHALVLNHDIGLWSGNRRRMEIAECRKSYQVSFCLNIVDVRRLEHTCRYDQRPRKVSVIELPAYPR